MTILLRKFRIYSMIQSGCVKINVDVKRDCMTYAFEIIFIQEHVRSRYKRDERLINTIATMMGDKGPHKGQ